MSINQSGWRPTAPQAGGTDAPTFTGNKALMLEEALIFEIGDTETPGVDFTGGTAAPATDRLGGLARSAPIGLPGLAEPEAVRLHGVVASSIQAGDGEAAEAAMLAIVQESSTAVETVRALETLTNSAQIIDEMARENRSY